MQTAIDYNEGSNAGFDSRVVVPGSASFVFNNYLRLGFFIAGAAGRFVFGDMIITGWIVSLLPASWVCGYGNWPHGTPGGSGLVAAHGVYLRFLPHLAATDGVVGCEMPWLRFG